jgi:hypothetical protein
MCAFAGAAMVAQIASFLQPFECFYKLLIHLLLVPLGINLCVMKKHPFTSYGIGTLQQQLYSLGDEDLRAEAASLAADPCSWIASHIELEVHQLECLRSIEEGFMQVFGWNIAASVLGRRPVTVSYKRGPRRDDPIKKYCILYTFRLTSHLGASVTLTGSLDIVFTEIVD